MITELVISCRCGERLIGLAEDRCINEIVLEDDEKSLTGSIYVGRVKNVSPDICCAFVDIGEGKNGALFAKDACIGKQSIQDALKRDDEVLVQVVRDALGNKGVMLTRKLKLFGKTCVLIANERGVKLSKRAESGARRRLEALGKSIAEKTDCGVIMRSAAATADDSEIMTEVLENKRRIDGFVQRSKTERAPKKLHDANKYALQRLRNECSNVEIDKIYVDCAECRDYVLEALGGEYAPIICADKAECTEMLTKLNDAANERNERIVRLENGAYIVIDKTEALTAIDVNMGGFVGSDATNGAAFNVNICAVREAVRQLRLRDVGGIVIVDIIDMDEPTGRDAVLAELRECMRADRGRCSSTNLTPLGLIELTRRKRGY